LLSVISISRQHSTHIQELVSVESPHFSGSFKTWYIYTGTLFSKLDHRRH